MSASEILSDMGLRLGTAKKSSVLLAYRLADDEFTIQAWDARTLFGGARPEWHSTQQLDVALVRLGCTSKGGRA